MSKRVSPFPLDLLLAPLFGRTLPEAKGRELINADDKVGYQAQGMKVASGAGEQKILHSIFYNI